MSYAYRGGGGGSASPQMCENCHTRPKYGNFEYCGKTCAEDAKRKAGGGGIFGGVFNTQFWGGSGGDDDGTIRTSSQYASRPASGSSYGSAMPQRAANDDNLCDQCHARPKHAEKDPRTGAVTIFPFCGRNCRNLSAQQNVPRCQLRDCGKPTPGGPWCSDSHAKKAVKRGEAQACAYCKELPATLPYEYCTKDCGMKDAREKERTVPPLALITPDKNQYMSIAKRFHERWDDELLAPPDITAIYQINVSRKYETRFRDAVNAAERLGGSITKSAFYGGQCICDLGVQQFGNDQLCSWGSCSICIVIRKCFDVLEFKYPHHVGDLGKGIYANLNPAKAHRFTVRKSNHPQRAIILCSIVQLDDHVPGDTKKYSAHIEEQTGRVFCANKDVILPRQLILYNNPEPKAIRH